MTVQYDGAGNVNVTVRTEGLTHIDEDEDSGGSGGDDDDTGGGGDAGDTDDNAGRENVKMTSSTTFIRESILLHLKNVDSEKLSYLSMYMNGATGYEDIVVSATEPRYAPLADKLAPSDPLVGLVRTCPTISVPVINVVIEYDATSANATAGGSKYPGTIPSGMTAICTSVSTSSAGKSYSTIAKKKTAMKHIVENWQIGFFSSSSSVYQYTDIQWPPKGK